MVTSVHYLHQKNIIHRDIKLKNFLIQKDKNPQNIQIAIIDFGHACLYDQKNPPC